MDKRKIAAVYQTERYGQVCMLKETCPDTGEPQIRFYAAPPGDMFGVCYTAVTYTPDNAEDDTVARRDAAFLAFDADKARVYALLDNTFGHIIKEQNDG